MRFQLKPLPYGFGALEPHLSSATLETHYTKHHAGYMEKLAKALESSPMAALDLEEIVMRSSKDAAQVTVFHNAAQVLNHDLYWASMTPGGGGVPSDAGLRAALDAAFGSFAEFREQFVKTAEDLFGSGWVWLVAHPEKPGTVAIEGMKDADNPILSGSRPLLACDVWEHAYYLDHRNERKKYAELFVDRLVDWKLAARQLAALASAPSHAEARMAKSA